MSIQDKRIGWIGLGNMGLAMATNLQRHLLSIQATPLAYNNRTMSRGDELAKQGGKPYSSVVDLVKNSDIIFISLSDDDAVTQTISSILTSDVDVSNKIFLDTSTIHPNTTASINSQLTSVKALFVSAPVFGATPVAQQGQLLFALAGPKSAIDEIQPVIRACLARSIIVVSCDPRDATLLKTTGNFITAALAEIISEAHVFAEKAGLEAHVLEALIAQNYGTYAAGVSEKLTEGVYAPPAGERPRSDLNLAIKDVGHGIECAEHAGARLQVAELTMQRLVKAKQWAEREGRGLDSSSVYGVLREEAGLSFERQDVLKQRQDRTS